jgi:hypothetical protein
MAMKCKACSHENQVEIDRLLLTGTSLRIVAEKFGTSTTAMHRHKQHISQTLVKAREVTEVAKADTLLDQVRNLLRKAERLTEQAEDARQLDTALRGIAQVRSVLQLLGELSGQLAGKGTQIGIGINLGGVQPTPNFRSMSDDELRAILRRNGHPAPPLLEGDVHERNS